jgi:hypothetical protein
MHEIELINKWITDSGSTESYSDFLRAIQADKKMSSFKDLYMLSDLESVAIQFYTGYGSRVLNQNIGNDFFYEIKSLLLRSLEKLPNHEGIVCRNDKYIDNKAWIDSHVKGRIITYPFFMSTSKEEGFYDDYDVEIYFETKKGKDISVLSYVNYFGDDEREVLICPPAKFEVLDKKCENGKIVIDLFEL